MADSSPPKGFSLKTSTQNDIPLVYFNGFELGFTNGDVSLVARINQQPVADCRMSYTVAKTLVQKLTILIGQVEACSGREIITTDDMDAAMRKFAETLKNDE